MNLVFFGKGGGIFLTSLTFFGNHIIDFIVPLKFRVSGLIDISTTPKNGTVREHRPKDTPKKKKKKSLINFLGRIDQIPDLD